VLVKPDESFDGQVLAKARRSPASGHRLGALFEGGRENGTGPFDKGRGQPLASTARPTYLLAGLPEVPRAFRIPTLKDAVALITGVPGQNGRAVGRGGGAGSVRRPRFANRGSLMRCFGRRARPSRLARIPIHATAPPPA